MPRSSRSATAPRKLIRSSSSTLPSEAGKLGHMRRHRDPFEELEEFIMAAIDDATARITADIDKLVAALAAATGTGSTDTANAAALNAASDRAEAALSPPP